MSAVGTERTSRDVRSVGPLKRMPALKRLNYNVGRVMEKSRCNVASLWLF